MAGVRGSRTAAAGGSKGYYAYKLFVPTMFLLLFITTGSLLYGANPATHPVRISSTQIQSNHLHAYVARTFLALRSDPLKTRLDLLYKQGNDHVALVNAYAAYARKLKLDNMKQVRIFQDQGTLLTWEIGSLRMAYR